MALGCDDPEDWGMNVTEAEGREGRNCKSQLMAWEELVTKEAISTPLVPTPPPPRLPVSNSPRESPRKERGDLGVPGPLSVAPASWILIKLPEQRDRKQRLGAGLDSCPRS